MSGTASCTPPSYEGRPGRRPLSYDEVQRLFDAADDLVNVVRAQRRKGLLAAHRDAAILKTVYAYGLRRREAWGLDLPDLRHNPKVAAFGQVGALMVRWGKAVRGGHPARRTVLPVPEMDWVVPVLTQWVTPSAAFVPALTPRCGSPNGAADWIAGHRRGFRPRPRRCGLDPAWICTACGTPTSPI